MAISVFDIYKIGVGPSSSHTFGPMVAAQRFLKELEDEKLFEQTAKAQVELYSSMALTGKGHFTDLASMLGLEGNEPATLDSSSIPAKQKRIETEKTLNLGGKKKVSFDPAQDIKWYGDKSFPTHPNGIAFIALDKNGKQLKRGLYFSIGGGFVICEKESTHPKEAVGDKKKPFPYTTAAELAALCEKEGKSIAQLVFQNELIWRTAQEIKAKLLELAATMEKSIEVGLQTEGELPGGAGCEAARQGDLGKGKGCSLGRSAVRASGPYQRLCARGDGGERRPGPSRDGAHDGFVRHYPSRAPGLQEVRQGCDRR